MFKERQNGETQFCTHPNTNPSGMCSECLKILIQEQNKYILEELGLDEVINGRTYQTITGAVLRSPQWKEWYTYNQKNPKFDVDETQDTGWMSSEHFEAFIKFTNQEYSRKNQKACNI